MDKFLSCDWGTSTFRLRLVQGDDLKIIAEEKNDQGIAGTYKLWQNSGADPEKRQIFYASVITRHIQLLGKKLDMDLSGIPVIVSGMITASIGMVEVPYKAIPVAIDGSDLELKKLNIAGVGNEFILVSGIRSDDDVVRGEETKIVGCAGFFQGDEKEQLIIFPGTHPKQVTVKHNKVTSIKTYMTGEFFGLLATHSILAASVKKDDHFNSPANRESFKSGVADGVSNNLLHAAFFVRTNDILKKITPESNYYYLSGLLIGAELKDAAIEKRPVYLCGGSDLVEFYQVACDALGIKITMQIDADNALLRGQKQIWLKAFRVN